MLRLRETARERVDAVDALLDDAVELWGEVDRRSRVLLRGHPPPHPSPVSKAGPLPHGAALYDANLPLVETHAEARHFRLGEAACAHQLRPWREPIREPGAARIRA